MAGSLKMHAIPIFGETLEKQDSKESSLPERCGP